MLSEINATSKWKFTSKRLDAKRAALSAPHEVLKTRNEERFLASKTPLGMTGWVA